MSDCADFAAHLYEYVAGELGAQKHEELRAHVEKCPACAANLKSYQEIIELGGQLPPVALPPDLRERFLRAVEQEQSKEPEQRPPTRQPDGGRGP
jgi:anti-sigma factor (TIGR02949 family)